MQNEIEQDLVEETIVDYDIKLVNHVYDDGCYWQRGSDNKTSRVFADTQAALLAMANNKLSFF